MTKKFDRVLSDDWLPLEFQSGNSVPVTSVLVNLRTLKSIVEQTEQAVLQSPEIQALLAERDVLRDALETMVVMVEMNGFGRDYAMDVALAALEQ